MVCNDLAQYPEISYEALGVAVRLQSLPEGAPAGVKALAAKSRTSELKVASAMRELEAHGLLLRTRERTPDGRFVSRTASYNRPRAEVDLARETPRGALREAPRRPERQPVRESVQEAVREAVPEAAREAVPYGDPYEVPCEVPYKVPYEGPYAGLSADPYEVPYGVPYVDPYPYPDPVPAPYPDPVPDPEPAPAPDPHPALAPAPALHEVPQEAPPEPRGAVPAEVLPPRHHIAVELLAGLRAHEPRLLLSEADVTRLAPAVVAWFDRGVGPEAVRRTLCGSLPGELTHPAGLLARRLRDLLPPALPAAPAAAATAAPHPFQTCERCDRAFRSPEPGHCGDCRSEAGAEAGAARAGAGAGGAPEGVNASTAGPGSRQSRRP
ncbi:hypothetical protein [Streptomyces filamentosus]|uniref:hypothetical protein n=1 Tax=Streptomyces filamentosus TaxID=67294 RepID=UPI00123C76D3|nr:hypothetical protein [Streptomyces filamentosus]